MGDFNSAPNPPPNVLHPSWYASTSSQQANLQRANQAPHRAPLLTPKEDFLIIGLFALRLTRQMITSLPHYDNQLYDLNWLDTFLEPYDPAYDLAKATGSAKSEFLNMYPRVLSQMKRQDKYPEKFMAMDPTAPPRRSAWARQGRMTNADRKEIVDFADTATEWGSMVLVPRDEGDGILEMADRRLVADLGVGRGGVGLRGRSRQDLRTEDSPVNIGSGYVSRRREDQRFGR